MGRRAGIVLFGAAVEPHELLGPADAESRDERILDDLPGHAQGLLEILRQALDEDDGVILQADEAHPRRLGHEVPDLPLVGDLEGQARRHGRQAVETAGDRGLAARDDEPDDGHRERPRPCGRCTGCPTSGPSFRARPPPRAGPPRPDARPRPAEEEGTERARFSGRTTPLRPLISCALSGGRRKRRRIPFGRGTSTPFSGDRPNRRGRSRRGTARAFHGC